MQTRRDAVTSISSMSRNPTTLLILAMVLLFSTALSTTLGTGTADDENEVSGRIAISFCLLF